MTKAHDDRINSDGKDHGYSIRVGKTLPSNSANLAYVHSPRVNPKANLLITDLSSKIVDNTISNKSSMEKRVFPDDTFLLRQLGSPYYSPTSNIILTDEFSIPSSNQEDPVSLYYKAEIRGLFDGKGSNSIYWPGGYVEKPITELISYSQIDSARLASAGSLLYIGKKISITKLDGTPIDSTKKFKVQLIPYTGTGIPTNAFKVIIYTNFVGSTNETYAIRYEKYNSDGSHTSDFVEILNAYPFFNKVDKTDLDALSVTPKTGAAWKPELSDKKFSVVETPDKQWTVYSPSQVLIADNVTRPAHQFEYRIRGKLRAKLSSSEHGFINIGLIYTNENVFNAEDLTDVVKKTFESTYKPPYLDFINPHPPQVDLLKENAKYWNIDLSMPADYLNDYDLIIITGYGNIDMSIYNDALRSYLENGGRLWVDNAGSGTDVLKLNNFLTNVSFSESDLSTGVKQGGLITSSDALSLEVQGLNRLYVVNRDSIAMGYTSVNPKIMFGAGESATLWNNIVQYSSTSDPALMTRSIYGNGTLVVSNCGIFRSLANKVSDDIKVATNMILAIAEQKWVNTPWLRDYVYHRDNLFKEEYKNGDHDMYLDDRNDDDSTQIVAKKLLNKSVRDALIPYMPSSYYKSKGTFLVEVQSDSLIVIKNSDLEVGSAVATQWSTNTLNAIPGWNTQITSGTPIFDHVSSVSKRGSKALKISSEASAQAYWYTNMGQLSQGSYKASVWVKTSDVSSSGLQVGVYTTTGALISMSQIVIGTMDWTKIDVSFGLQGLTNLELRIGFLDAGTGTVWFDLASLVSVGSVFMTPESDGSKSLYAYAVRPRGNIFDLKSEGFSNADVTTYDPEIKINYTIKSFVYAWDNTLTRYLRKYGQSKSYTTSIRRSDGMLSLGLLTTLLPALEGGPDWADKNRVFFEISVGSPELNDTSSEFVNVGFFNTKNGQYFYTKTGEDVIGYTEIFDAPISGQGTEGYVIVQAWTTYYTIRATKRRYSVMVKDDERIYLEYPATIDDKEGWFLRVHNGNFTKRELQYDEYEKYKSLYANRSFGVFRYSVPEYERQVFAPSNPYRRVRKESAEYVNDSTIRVQRNPLYVQMGSARAESLSLMLNSDNKVFQSDHTNWSKTFTPKVYADTAGNGVYIEIVGGFDIDYENGLVIFEDTASGAVKADYNYNNLNVFKRTYLNAKVSREYLQVPSKTADHRTFVSDHKNWLLYPSPTLYVRPDGATADQVIPVTSYKINYEDGSIEFQGDTHDRIYVDYSYCIDKEIAVSDYDIQSGLIYLSSPINFKDEIYVNYYYEENFYEYRGYYDDLVKKFIHLDLNPTEGHYCTLPVHRVADSTTMVRYDNVPTAKLMNKEVYVYMVPRIGSFNIDNNYTIKHCYSEAEWIKISKTAPGIAILLGIIQLREHTRVNDVVVMDTRSRGGGLKSNINRDTIKQRDYNSINYWDVGPWDGTAYYRNGVLIIQLPKSILESEGGRFSEKQIADILKKYVAYGVYSIVEYIDQSEYRTMFIQGAAFGNTLNG